MNFLVQESNLIARLASNRLFSSGDLDETRSMVGQVFKPHDLHVYGKRQKLDAHMDHLPIGRVSVNRLKYGANVCIEPERLDDFLLVQMPLSGQAKIRCGSETLLSTPKKASVITPSLPLHMRWQEDNDQIIVRIERQALEDACSAQLGYALQKPLEYQLAMPLDTRQGLAWLQLVGFLSNSLFAKEASKNSIITTQIEQLVIASLLNNHPHNFSDAISERPRKPARRYLREAEEYLRAHCKQPITLATLANHVNISTRSLHYGFKEHFGIGPMAYLKLVRLQAIRERLLQAQAQHETLNITQLALDWGFAHLGRFSEDYRKQFGETPSQTLKQTPIA